MTSRAAALIPEKIFFKIGEVCDLVGVQPHVLRYWETEFPMLSPQKNRAGQRTYRRRDVEIAMRIKELLYEELFTIAGAKKKLSSELREQTKLKVVPNNAEPAKIEAVKTEPARVEQSPEAHQPIVETVVPQPFMPPPNVVRTFTAPNVFVENDEDFAHAANEFEHDEISSERKSALQSLSQQLAELLQILERPETAPHRWQ